MEKITIKTIVKKIEDSDINQFENNFKLKIPINLKKLLIRYNGGLVENSDYVKKFLSLKYGNINIDDIITTHQFDEKNIPKEYLPIALDWSGNVISINLKEGNDYGKVYGFYFDVDRIEVITNSLEELLGVNTLEEF
jgi:cell wall assembly regulator SMI1